MFWHTTWDNQSEFILSMNTNSNKKINWTRIERFSKNDKRNCWMNWYCWSEYERENFIWIFRLIVCCACELLYTFQLCLLPPACCCNVINNIRNIARFKFQEDLTRHRPNNDLNDPVESREIEKWRIFYW